MTEPAHSSLRMVCFCLTILSYTQTFLMDINTQIRIQNDPHFWYTVEDMNIDVGCDGFTLSYWEYDTKSNDDKRKNHITMDKDEALAVADAIHKLFKTGDAS